MRKIIILICVMVFINLFSVYSLSLNGVLTQPDLNDVNSKILNIKNTYDIDISLFVDDSEEFNLQRASNIFTQKGLDKGTMNTYNILVFYNKNLNKLGFATYEKCSLDKYKLKNILNKEDIKSVLEEQNPSNEEISYMLYNVINEVSGLVQEKNPKPGVCTLFNYENKKCSEACEQGILGLMPCDLDDCHNYDNYGLNCFFIDEFFDKCEDCNDADDCSNFNTDRNKCKDINCGGKLNCEWKNGECIKSTEQQQEATALTDPTTLSLPTLYATFSFSDEQSFINNQEFNFYVSDLGDSILTQSQDDNVNPLLIASLIKQESTLGANSISNCGAVGIMQLMPDSARDFNLYVPDYAQVDVEGCAIAYECRKGYEDKCDKINDERFNEKRNLEGGIEYLRRLYSTYLKLDNVSLNPDPHKNEYEKLKLILAAYNAGQYKVIRNCKDSSGNYVTFDSCKNKFPRQTRDYVENILDYYSQYVDQFIVTPTNTLA
ncbi:MAG: transglycosylase SLT domain-containing protein [archaeon]